MFKKDPQVKALANVKTSERRKLLASVCSTYGVDASTLSKDIGDLILPLPTKMASFKSVQGYTGSILCDSNETPTWFKERDGQWIPSVFTLWKCPFLLPNVRTHDVVMEILEGGANLMLPGTIPPFDPKCTRGAIVGIVSAQHPTVVRAVGRCMLNLAEFDRTIGRTGVAVEILHHVGDELFKLNKYVDIPIPSTVEDPRELVISQATEMPSEQIEAAAAPNSVTPTETKKDALLAPLKVSETADVIQPPLLAPSDMPEIADAVETLSAEEVDNFFHKSLLQTIKCDTLQLPMLASAFMSGHIYKNLPIIDPSFCNVKKTSWKKTAKYLKAMEKEKLLTLKGKDDDLSIVLVASKDKDVIKNFLTYTTMGSRSSAPHVPTLSKKAHELSIQIWYKPNSKVRAVLEKVLENQKSYLSANELKLAFEKYVKTRDLVNESDRETIKVDDLLKSVVHLGPAATPREKVFLAFLANCSRFYRVVKPTQLELEAEMCRGDPPKILVVTEMRIGRKVITRVSNFEPYFIKPHLLSDELKVKCSGSSTIGPMVQNPSITEVTVQGPHGKLVIELLREKGVPILYIQFEDKLKKKKKRT